MGYWTNPLTEKELHDFLYNSDDDVADPTFTLDSDEEGEFLNLPMFPLMMRRRGNRKSARNRTFKYFLKSEQGAKHEVCKSFFLVTLGYNPKNDRIITNVLDKEDRGTFRPSIDMRGKHAKTPKTDRDLIRSHVESFSPTVSQYRREHAPNKRYLPSDLSIKTMHTDFMNLHPNIKCSYELYRKYISKDLNISFTRLGHEECETCDSFKLHNPDHTKNCLLEDYSSCDLWRQHIKKATESREMYKSEAENNFPQGTVCFFVDLEKVIMLPRIDMFKRVVFCQRIIAFNESFVPVVFPQSSLELNFLKIELLKGHFEKPPIISQLRGIKEERKQMILTNLIELIPENRIQFFSLDCLVCDINFYFVFFLIFNLFFNSKLCLSININL
ncbi:hypothetical protein RN001_005984 [Aquatica leii]|uniref:Uncharacterized protein n=1 Tax=Aquatica leii TaxID=1421715 RepID=A0AAN7Q8H0_9COLE|nr:hypothetical protein RN001_005984 [Aquatica leii]